MVVALVLMTSGPIRVDWRVGGNVGSGFMDEVARLKARYPGIEVRVLDIGGAPITTFVPEA